MTEVIIAFLLLTIIFSILYHSINFASNMMKRAKDMDVANGQFEQSAAMKFSGQDPYDLPAAGSTDSDVVQDLTPSLNFKAVSGSGSYTISVQGRRVKLDDGSTDGDTVVVYATGS